MPEKNYCGNVVNLPYSLLRRSRRASAVPVTASSADPMDEDTETECEEDGDEEESSMLSLDEDVASGGDPYWLLFKAIATHTDDMGKSTTKPFLKLPNKRLVNLCQYGIFL